MLILSILASKLGVSFYGEYVVLLSFVSIFVIIGDLGLGMLLPKLISKHRFNTEKISKYASFYFLVKIFAAILLAIILFVLLKNSLTLKVIILLYLVMRVINPEIIFHGLEDYKYIATINLLSKIIQVFLILTINFADQGLEKLFGVTLFVLFLTNILLYHRLFFKLKLGFEILPFKVIRTLIRSSLGFYFARFFQNLYSQGSTYVISFFLSIELVAIYSIATDFYKAGGALIGGVGRVLYTSLALTKNFILLKKITAFSLLLHIIFLPSIYFFGGMVLDLMFEFDVEVLYQLSLFLYVSLAFTIINSFWGYPALTAVNEERLAHICLIATAVTYYAVLSILVLSGQLTIINAVFCIIIADFAGVLMRIIFALHKNILP